MPSPERQFAVSLRGRRVGILHAREDTSWFTLDRAYLENPEREVLGLRFEEAPRSRQRVHMRLPPWFSNLLPEGPLRTWIAAQRGVSIEREVELLAEVGHDLPGAVRVEPTEETAEAAPPEVIADRPRGAEAKWRFSLAGVQLKFSMFMRAEVRGFYPQEKYKGSFETVAALVHRRRHDASALELARRLAFNVLIRNADAHLKNWSLLYRDPRVPELSPAYDLVATSVYPGVDRDLGLRFGGSRRFEDVSYGAFEALQKRVGVGGPPFREAAEEVVQRALAAWPEVEQLLVDTPLARSIGEVLRSSAEALHGPHRLVTGHR